MRPVKKSLQLEAIIEREARVVERGNGHDLETTAISRAAHAAWRAAEKATSADSTIDGIAHVLGVQAITQDPNSSIRRKLMREPISAEQRQHYGYGDLPEELITDVKRGISQVMPEHQSQTLALIIAARTMSIVRDTPQINAHELRERLMVVNAEQPLAIGAKELPLDTLAALNSAIIISHQLSTNYYSRQSDLAVSFNQQAQTAAQAINA